MGSFGGYFKGEKKKKKQAAGKAAFGFAPVFTLPKIIQKGKVKES